MENTQFKKSENNNIPVAGAPESNIEYFYIFKYILHPTCTFPFFSVI